jgi:hypothetical protein
MAMTTAQGTAAIDTALAEEIAEFAASRAQSVHLTDDSAYEENAALALRIKTRLLTDLDTAWSD